MLSLFFTLILLKLIQPFPHKTCTQDNDIAAFLENDIVIEGKSAYKTFLAEECYLQEFLMDPFFESPLLLTIKNPKVACLDQVLALKGSVSIDKIIFIIDQNTTDLGTLNFWVTMQEIQDDTVKDLETGIQVFILVTELQTLNLPLLDVVPSYPIDIKFDGCSFAGSFDKTIPFLYSVRELTFRNVSIDSENIEIITSIVNNCSQLTSLTISECSMNDSSIFGLLNTFPEMELLNLNGTFLDDQHAKSFRDNLYKFPALEILGLKHVKGFTQTGVSYIIESIAATSIEHVFLTDSISKEGLMNDITLVSKDELYQVLSLLLGDLKRMKKLKTIDLPNNLFKYYCPTLKTFRLDTQELEYFVSSLRRKVDVFIDGKSSSEVKKCEYGKYAIRQALESGSNTHPLLEILLRTRFEDNLEKMTINHD